MKSSSLPERSNTELVLSLTPKQIKENIKRNQRKSTEDILIRRKKFNEVIDGLHARYPGTCLHH